METPDDVGELRYFFDVSALYNYVRSFSRYTGIQRVVATLLENFSRYGDAENAYLCFRERSLGRYRCIRLADVDPLHFRSPALVASVTGQRGIKEKSLPPLRKYEKNKTKYIFQRTKFDIFANIGLDGPFKKHGLDAKTWQEMRHPDRRVDIHGKQVDFFSIARPSDRFVVIDSAWLPKDIDLFKTVKEHGLQVYTFVYDLVPLKMPHVTSGNMPNLFLRSLIESTGYTSEYIAISDSTRRDLAEFIEGRGASIPIRVLPLAQDALPQNRVTITPQTVDAGCGSKAIDVDFIDEVSGLRDEIRSVATVPYVLCVGSIEPRKNGWRVATAWARLRELRGVEVPRLVFAGGSGWAREDFDSFLRGTGSLDGWVQLVDRPSDEELAFLYRHCSFTIMASLYEGWGLPVGESLAYGKTAVISKSSSLPEVGGELVQYCDPLSIESIEEACKELICVPKRRLELEDKIKSSVLRNWKDVADDFINIIGK